MLFANSPGELSCSDAFQRCYFTVCEGSFFVLDADSPLRILTSLIVVARNEMGEKTQLFIRHGFDNEIKKTRNIKSGKFKELYDWGYTPYPQSYKRL